MAKKKTRKSNKMPEKSISEKVNHYKGETRTLRKRIDNLEKRMLEMEQRLTRYKKLLPTEPKHVNFEQEKETDDPRQEFLRKFHPNFKEEE